MAWSCLNRSRRFLRRSHPPAPTAPRRGPCPGHPPDPVLAVTGFCPWTGALPGRPDEKNGVAAETALPDGRDVRYNVTSEYILEASWQRMTSRSFFH